MRIAHIVLIGWLVKAALTALIIYLFSKYFRNKKLRNQNKEIRK